MKQKIHFLIWPAVALASLVFMISVTIVQPMTVHAVDPSACTVGDGDLSVCKDTAANKCAGGEDCGLIKKYVNPFIAFLSAGVGLAVTISIIVAGIQYSSSGGDPQKSAAAKNRIRNAIIALVAFMLLLGFLRFMTPGGI